MQAAQWEASKANLVPCGNCGRRFASDRIVAHERICTKTGGGKGNKTPAGNKPQEDLVSGVSCMSDSLMIHISLLSLVYPFFSIAHNIRD